MILFLILKSIILNPYTLGVLGVNFIGLMYAKFIINKNK